MAFFGSRWIRRFIRRNTNPIPEGRAEAVKKKLSIIYAVCAWNAFGLVLYMIWTGKADWMKYYNYKTDDDEKLSPGHQWIKYLDLNKDAKVYRMRGLSLEEVKPTESEKENAEN